MYFINTNLIKGDRGQRHRASAASSGCESQNQDHTRKLSTQQGDTTAVLAGADTQGTEVVSKGRVH